MAFGCWHLGYNKTRSPVTCPHQSLTKWVAPSILLQTHRAVPPLYHPEHLLLLTPYAYYMWVPASPSGHRLHVPLQKFLYHSSQQPLGQAVFVTLCAATPLFLCSLCGLPFPFPPRRLRLLGPVVSAPTTRWPELF